MAVEGRPTRCHITVMVDGRPAEKTIPGPIVNCAVRNRTSVIKGRAIADAANGGREGRAFTSGQGSRVPPERGVSSPAITVKSGREVVSGPASGLIRQATLTLLDATALPAFTV